MPTVFLVLACAGCTGLSTVPAPLGRTTQGELRMDRASRRHLRVQSHTSRRDPHERLVVSVRVENVHDDPYIAEIRVIWYDATGRPTPGSAATDLQEFAPHQSQRIEWTSPVVGAARYAVEFRSGRAFQW
jgi:uncharacterized protein YcfL